MAEYRTDPLECWIKSKGIEASGGEKHGCIVRAGDPGQCLRRRFLFTRLETTCLDSVNPEKVNAGWRF